MRSGSVENMSHPDPAKLRYAEPSTPDTDPQHWFL